MYLIIFLIVIYFLCKQHQLLPAWSNEHVWQHIVSHSSVFLLFHNMDSYLFVMRPIYLMTEEIKTDNLQNRYQFDLDLWVNDAFQKNVPFNLFR